MPHKHRRAQDFEWFSATLIAIVCLSMLLFLGLISPRLSSAAGNAEGKIAFTRGSVTAEEIYVMNADGSAQTRVTNNAVRDYFPVISPNGAKIAFESERNGNRDIYVIDPDGTNEQRLTTVPGVDLHPAWSPDGTQIAFSSEQNGNRDIYVMNADGSNQRRVTTHPGADLHPVYSLDGTKFLFASERDGDREIFLIRSAVTESEFDQPLRLTDNTAFDSFPSWSPDGTKIVFHSRRDGNHEIYVMGVNGENQTNLTRSTTDDIFPNWSPDGTKIIFESLRGGNRDIYVMDATGNNPTRLTTDVADDLIPSWHWERTDDVKTISGRVRGISGEAVGNLKINVRRVADVAANCVASDTFVRTLADGTYSIQVTPGCFYTVEPDPQELMDRFGSTGTARPTSVNVFVAFNLSAVDFVAGMTPQPSITGRIIDASKCPNYNPLTDGNLECGLPGVTVTGEWTGETRTDVSKPINVDPSISGTYTLPSFLTNSVVRVRAFLPGYVITIIPPNTEQITLTNVTRPLVDFLAVRANSNPAVSLIDPANGTTYPPAPQILINANASDSDGSISRVEFFQGTTKLGEDSSGPYSFTWNGVVPGNYSLTAVATDNGGASTTSSPVNITVNAPPNEVQFSASTATATETLNATTKVDLTVTRTGNLSGAAMVTYENSDGTASDRSDYLAAVGSLRFAAGETTKTISVFIVDDRFGESAETFNVTLSNPVGLVLGSPASVIVTINSDETVNGVNPVTDPNFSSDFFVRQHYLDFFNREADPAGLGFWKNQIDECTDQACREIRRINVSAAFFLSGEFQQTGYLVYKAYQASFNSGEQLALRDFLPDTQEIGRGVVIGQPGADQQLETNKQNFFLDFVQRSAFRAPTAYPTTFSAAEFVDKLNSNTLDPLNPGAGPSLTQDQRDALVDQLTLDPTSSALRAQVLRSVSENGVFTQRQFNKAFVLMQYLGYLRRNPNDAPDGNFDGYNFWLGKLNQFNGNFVSAEMVKAFILAGEYKQRFGP
jgi:Bacterial Ig domain/Calx-beta domain/WD40-like Beta Propeller Repeat/Domain of unknown function (DUF4214)